MLKLSRLYPIIDIDSLLAAHGERALLTGVCDFASQLLVAGVTVLQYRSKNLSSRQILAHARELRHLASADVKLIMNDRADLALAAEFDGVHVGQDDLPVASARHLLGRERIVGISTHNSRQFDAAL